MLETCPLVVQRAVNAPRRRALPLHCNRKKQPEIILRNGVYALALGLIDRYLWTSGRLMAAQSALYSVPSLDLRRNENIQSQLNLQCESVKRDFRPYDLPLRSRPYRVPARPTPNADGSNDSGTPAFSYVLPDLHYLCRSSWLYRLPTIYRFLFGRTTHLLNVG
jgi:hypothetical protein